MKLFSKAIIFLVSVTFTANAFSQSTIIINNDDQLINLANNCLVYKDVGARISYDKLPQISGLFYPYHNPYINFGITETPYWLKINFVSKISSDIYLEVGNTALDTIQVYEVHDGNAPLIHLSGNWVPFKNREVEHVNYLYKLHAQKDKLQTIYVRVKHSRGTQFPLFIGTIKNFFHESAKSDLYSGMYYGLIVAMIFFNLFIYISLKDVAYIYYVAYIFFMGLLNASLSGHAFKFFWPSYPLFNKYVDIIAVFVGLAGILFVIKFLETKRNTPRFHILFRLFACLYIINIIPIALGYGMFGTIMIESLSVILIVSFFFCALVSMRMNFKPAKFFLIAWTFLLFSVVIFILKDFIFIPYHPLTANALQIGSAAEALLLSMALANRINIYKQEKEKAQVEAFLALDEKKKLITEQNEMLEKQVASRTKEIKAKHDELVSALSNLKFTQARLIQREKMASLGELTAGIAHEIQNPLNFVNNFSDVSEELINELIESLRKDVVAANDTETLDILDNLKNNIKLISDHGKRADSIVKSMLQHTRANKGVLEPTNINGLVEEYLRLSYVGFKTKNGQFSSKIVTQYDNSIGKVNVVPQDIARVFINLFNNAFYALNEKCKNCKNGYEPELQVSTILRPPNLELHIKDNGIGIPPEIINKIFQPFYTTKPPGKGTGLGLSLSYDIITKEHRGDLTVDSRINEFTEFTISLPSENLQEG